MNKISRLEIFRKLKSGTVARSIERTKDYYGGTTKNIEYEIQDNGRTLKVWIDE